MSAELVAAVASLSAKVDGLAEKTDGMVARNTVDHERVRGSIEKLTDKVDTASQVAAENGAMMRQQALTNADVEQRVRFLERWLWWLVGGMTAIGSVAGMLGALIPQWWKGTGQ